MKNETGNIQDRISAWERVEKELIRLKREEMRKPGYLEDSLASLAEIFNYAVENAPQETTSGLVEMQRYFAKLRGK